MSNSPRRHLHIESVDFLGLIGRHTFQEVLGIHLVEGQHVTISVSELIGAEVPLHHRVIAHAQHLIHHLTQVGTLLDGLTHTTVDKADEE